MAIADLVRQDPGEQTQLESESSSEQGEVQVRSTFVGTYARGFLGIPGFLESMAGSNSSAESNPSTFLLTPEGVAWLAAGDTEPEEPSGDPENLLTPGVGQILEDAEENRDMASLVTSDPADDTTVQASPRNTGELSEAPNFALSAANEDPRASRARERGQPAVAPETQEEAGGPSGTSLTPAEKPVILAIIEEEIGRNGLPARVTLIMKRLLSTRFKPVKYTLFKKSIFTDEVYSVATEVFPENLLDYKVSPRYNAAVRNAGFKPADVFTFTDENIDSGRVYAYKLKLRFVNDPETQAQLDEFGDISHTAQIIGLGLGAAGGGTGS